MCLDVWRCEWKSQLAGLLRRSRGSHVPRSLRFKRAGLVCLLRQPLLESGCAGSVPLLAAAAPPSTCASTAR